MRWFPLLVLVTACGRLGYEPLDADGPDANDLDASVDARGDSSADAADDVPGDAGPDAATDAPADVTIPEDVPADVATLDPPVITFDALVQEALARGVATAGEVVANVSPGDEDLQCSFAGGPYADCGAGVDLGLFPFAAGGELCVRFARGPSAPTCVDVPAFEPITCGATLDATAPHVFAELELALSANEVVCFADGAMVMASEENPATRVQATGRRVLHVAVGDSADLVHLRDMGPTSLDVGALYFIDAPASRITGLAISTLGFAATSVQAEGTTDLTLVDVEISALGNGASAFEGFGMGSLVVRDSRFVTGPAGGTDGDGYAVACAFCAGVDVRDSELVTRSYYSRALALDESHGAVIRDNVFTLEDFGSYGVELVDSDDLYLADNVATVTGEGSTFLYLVAGDRALVERNTITMLGQGARGLDFRSATAVRVLDNEIAVTPVVSSAAPSAAVYFGSASAAVVTRNTLTIGNSAGAALDDWDSTVDPISGNTFRRAGTLDVVAYSIACHDSAFVDNVRDNVVCTIDGGDWGSPGSEFDDDAVYTWWSLASQASVGGPCP